MNSRFDSSIHALEGLTHLVQSVENVKNAKSCGIYQWKRMKFAIYLLSQAAIDNGDYQRVFNKKKPSGPIFQYTFPSFCYFGPLDEKLNMDIDLCLGYGLIKREFKKISPYDFEHSLFTLLPKGIQIAKGIEKRLTEDQRSAIIKTVQDLSNLQKSANEMLYDYASCWKETKLNFFLNELKKLPDVELDLDSLEKFRHLPKLSEYLKLSFYRNLYSASSEG